MAVVLAFTQPNQSKTHSLHGAQCKKRKHLFYHVIMMLSGRACGDDVIASAVASIVCVDFPLSLQ